MSRNQIGVVLTDVFASVGDRVEFPAFTTGWDLDYSTPASGKFPERTAFNDLFAKVTAVGVDVNKYGGSLPWDTNILYSQYAVVTGSDGVIYRALSQQIGNNPVSSPAEWKPLEKDDIGLGNVDNTSDLAKPVSNAQQAVFYTKIPYTTDGYVVVPHAATDVLRYTSLVDSYNFAKTLTPGGNALASDNRAAVIIPPGTYEVGTSTFPIDTDFVDIIALVSEMGGTDIGTYQPNNVIITGAPATNDRVIEITAEDVHLNGFSAVSRTVDTVPLRITQPAGTGENCRYENLYLWVEGGTLLNVSFPNGDLGMTNQNIRGTWLNCVCSFDYAWRINGWGTPANAIFDADMKNCHAGDRSFGGDVDDVPSWETLFRMENCLLENCKAGATSFAGCGGWGIGIYATATFVECEAEDNSYGIGVDVQGTFIRCRGKRFCVGSTTADGYPGKFSGYAEGCNFQGGSLGGAATSTVLPGECSGNVTRCIIGDYDNFTQSGIKETTLASAAIIDSHYFVLNDGFGLFIIEADGGVLTKIIGCKLQMFPSVAHPIDAAVARDVVFAGCTVNNQASSATGLGANVTNKAPTPANGVYNLF